MSAVEIGLISKITQYFSRQRHLQSQLHKQKLFEVNQDKNSISEDTPIFCHEISEEKLICDRTFFLHFAGFVWLHGTIVDLSHDFSLKLMHVGFFNNCKWYPNLKTKSNSL